MGRMTGPLHLALQKFLTLLLVTGITVSCLPSANTNIRGRVNANVTGGSSSVGVGQGRVLKDNPVALSHKSSLPLNYDLNKLLGAAVSITNNPFLQGNENCEGLDYCFEIRDSRMSVSSLQTTDGKWGFNASSDEFLQVNTFYHMNKIFDQFFSNINLSLDSAYDPFTKQAYYDTAIPYSLRNPSGLFELKS